MKKLIIGAFALFTLATTAQAQDAKRGKGKERKEAVAQKLGLNEDQQTKMKAINDAQRAEMKALKDDGTTAEADKATRRKAIHQKYAAQREALLTSEQKAKAAEMRKAGKEKMKAKGKEKGKDRKDAVLRAGKKLDLNEDQKAKMTSIYSSFRNERESIQKDNSLTDAQKKEKIRSLKKSQKDQAKAVLSPEQLAKAEEMRKDFRKSKKK